jgi:hypothetical protein
MNFSQLHERLRAEMARRIERGQLTGTLLARQTGLQPSHLSNFIRRKRRLSLPALEDLIPDSPRPNIQTDFDDASVVPLVSHETALRSPAINQRSVLDLIHLPAGSLDHLRPRRTLSRREWQRFLAVRLTPAQARPMEPLLAPGSIAIIDRHYNSLAPSHPARPNVYAIDVNNDLVFRYLSYEANRLVLRPRSLDSRVEVLRLAPDESPSSCIVGRLCLTIAEL